MNIRAYQTSDLASICDLIVDLGYTTTLERQAARMNRILNEPSYETFVAEHHGQVVGMVGVRLLYSYEIDEIAAQISALVVSKQHQANGIGRALVGYVEQWALQNGAKLIVLTSSIKEERKVAHQFYQALGFDITGYRFVKRL